MQKYLNIYLEEFKVQFKTYFLSILAFLSLSAYLMWVIIGTTRGVDSSGQMQTSYMISPAGKLYLVSNSLLPLFLITQIIFFFNSLKEKYLSETNYLLYSVPAKRYTSLLIKFAVFTSYLIFTVIIMFLWSFAVMDIEIQQNKDVMLRSNILPGNPVYSELMGLDKGILFFVLHRSHFFFAVKLYASLTFFISGLLVFIKTLKYKIKWVNSFVQTIAALFLFVIFCQYGLIDLNQQHNIVGLFSILSCIAVGTFFMILGLIVYEKYGQI